jgi:hypothetical protein
MAPALRRVATSKRTERPTRFDTYSNNGEIVDRQPGDAW